MGKRNARTGSKPVRPVLQVLEIWGDANYDKNSRRIAFSSQIPESQGVWYMFRSTLLIRSVRCRSLLAIAGIAAVVHGTVDPCQAGVLFRRAVGGVSISPEGILDIAAKDDLLALRRHNEQAIQPAPAELEQGNGLRKISLRQLEAAIEQARKENRSTLPESIRFLGGLQRVEFVFVYPEQNDIVLAGPGEGWQIDEHGEVVGRQSGRPVLLLDDLLVALRSVDEARQGGITCSIDPTPEGIENFKAFMRKQKRFHPDVAHGIEEVLGPQQISVIGVPDTSHFARVLVAADFHMKRIAMNLDPSPVEGITSYLEMMQKSRARVTNMMPRWWLACDYDALARSEDGLAWQLRGQGVKCLTEDEVRDDDGNVQGTGKSSKLAQKWADDFTDQYASVSQAQPVFGQLRNLMDLCVIAAILEKENLYQRANCPLPLLRESAGGVEVEVWHGAKSVSTQSSFVKRQDEWIITASGGVQIGSWQATENTIVQPQVELQRVNAQRPAGPSINANRFWW